MSKIFKKRAGIALLGFLLLFSIFATGCDGKQETGKKQQTKTRQNVIRIGYQKNCPLLILKASGTLEKRLKPLGVKVEWYEFQSGTALLESLNSGNIDFGRTGDSPPIFAQASGSGLKYVGVGKSKYEGSAILVKKNSPIRSVADLKGKKSRVCKRKQFPLFSCQSTGKKRPFVQGHHAGLPTTGGCQSRL
nr:PhnD/SsuA/transferrin family substrate-binding protein [Heyndrickxia coagulans]